MAARDLQRKDVTVTAQLGCNGALLPPSFQKVADLGGGGGGGRGRAQKRASVILQVRVVGLHPLLTPCLDRSGSESPEH